MRRIDRLPLPAGVRFALGRRQVKANRQRWAPGFKASRAWDNARRSKPLLAVEATLKHMAGDTERCMYCDDSHGADIEHFRPKTPFPECLFVWRNLLLCCTECGRAKGDRFPIDASGEPLLIDPTADDPWDHLDFDPETGNLVPRFHLDAGNTSPKGETTVSHLQLDRREALAKVYRRSFLRLGAVVSEVLEAQTLDSLDLVARLRERDDHGLLAWCLHGNGQRVEPFSSLRVNHPDVWTECCRRLATSSD